MEDRLTNKYLNRSMVNAEYAKLADYEDIEELHNKIIQKGAVYEKHNGVIYMTFVNDVLYSIKENSIVVVDEDDDNIYLPISEYGKSWSFDRKVLENDRKRSIRKYTFKKDISSRFIY